MKSVVKLSNVFSALLLMVVFITASNVHAAKIAVSSHRTCAVVDGGVKCWGTVLDDCDGVVQVNPLPVAVIGLETDVTDIGVGNDHACAIAAGRVKCWGSNQHGELGVPEVLPRSEVPIPVEGIEGQVTKIAIGDYLNCAIVNGGVKCWGGFGGWDRCVKSDWPEIPFTARELLSHHASFYQSTVELRTGVTDISVSGHDLCAVINGAVKCWRDGFHIKRDGVYVKAEGIPMIAGADRSMDRAIGGTISVQGLEQEVVGVALGSVVCGYGIHGLKCTSNRVWGRSRGQSPLEVQSSLGIEGVEGEVTGISIGSDDINSLCAIVNGGVKCLEDNGYLLPQAGVTDIASSDLHACALVHGAVKCWGNNEYGQLGNITDTHTSGPIVARGMLGAELGRAIPATHNLLENLALRRTLIAGRTVRIGFGALYQVADVLTQTEQGRTLDADDWAQFENLEAQVESVESRTVFKRTFNTGMAFQTQLDRLKNEFAPWLTPEDWLRIEQEQLAEMELAP